MEAPLRECQTGGQSAIRPDGKNSTSHDAWNVISITGQKASGRRGLAHGSGNPVFLTAKHAPNSKAQGGANDGDGCLQAVGWAVYTGQP